MFVLILSGVRLESQFWTKHPYFVIFRLSSRIPRVNFKTIPHLTCQLEQKSLSCRSIAFISHPAIKISAIQISRLPFLLLSLNLSNLCWTFERVNNPLRDYVCFLGPHDSVFVFSLYLFHCLFMSVCVKSLANIKIIIVSVILLKWRTINNMHWCVLHHFTLASTKLWWRDLVFSLVLFSWLSFLQVRFTVVDVFPGSFIKTKQYILTGLVCLENLI